MPSQKQTLNNIQKIFLEIFGEQNFRIIKLHGDRYQEAGLPDIDVYTTQNLLFKFEIKRSWNDEPTELQKWNIKDARRYGFLTGYVVGNQFKPEWNSKMAVSLKQWVSIQFRLTA